MDEEPRWLPIRRVYRVIAFLLILEYAARMDVVEKLPLLVRGINPRLLSLPVQFVAPSTVSLAIVPRIDVRTFSRRLLVVSRLLLRVSARAIAARVVGDARWQGLPLAPCQ